ncbi:MAG TPA: hypothetical protein VL990_04220 [Acidobacteriaceae bacterium]|nr:hypothetical protein [Acidobacteriaceae bacterium]
MSMLEHANTLTDIRAPGAAPFDLKVTFHAYPGLDFARKGKPTIITGDGSYEELWLSPERWRREVLFTGYHAVEIRANGVRKYRADSDYEPSRVLMMLDALLDPVPRNLISPEFAESHQDWRLDHLTAGTIPYVTLIHREPGMNSDWFYTSYSLLSDGILVRSNYYGLMTSWEKDSSFAGKLVPLHFETQALGHTLLTADVTISPAGEVDPKLFELDGPPATPGMTMRPLHNFEIKPAEYYDPVSTFLGPSPRGVLREIIDRQGHARETEVIDSPEPQDDENFVLANRAKRFYPAKVDGDPCEETFWLRG